MSNLFEGRASGILQSFLSPASTKSRRGLALHPLAVLAGPSPTAAYSEPVVQIEACKVRHRSADGIFSWKGVPFSAPPVRAQRWHAPQAVRAWRSIHDARQYGADCTQSPVLADAAPLGTPSAEGCLFVNIRRLSGIRTKRLLSVFDIVAEPSQ